MHRRTNGPRSPSPASPVRRVVFWAAYWVAILLLVTAIVFVLHVLDVRKLAAIDKPASARLPTVPGGSQALARQVGLNWFRADRLSSFTKVPLAKPAGVIRVGAFGDSFTFGDEVDGASDFPSQLSTLLRDHGFDHVEVLNFGVNGFGFDETFLTWNELAAAYAIDYVLLGPGTFYSERTTRFNSWRVFPYYLHSRFVLDGDGLIRVDVLGDSYDERFRVYNAFLAPWRYLRYDRNDPSFMAAALPEGRVIGNPFYYSALPEKDEAAIVHRRLLATMKGQGKPIILGLHPGFEELRRTVADLADEHLCVIDIDRPMDFPYLAPRGHNSATGNRRVALFYLAALVGEPIEVPVLRTGEPDDVAGAAVLPSPNVTAYDELWISLNGTDIGRLADAEGRFREPPSLRDRGLGALIAFKPVGRSLLDAVILALPSGLDPSLPIRLVHKAGGRATSAVIHSRMPVGGLPSLRSADLPLRSGWWRDPPGITADDLSTVFGETVGSGTLEVLLGDQVILEGKTTGDASDTPLHPTAGEFLYFRSASTGDATAVRNAQTGIADLVLRHSGRNYALPAARWWIEPRKMGPAYSAGWAAPLAHLRQAGTD